MLHSLTANCCQRCWWQNRWWSWMNIQLNRLKVQYIFLLTHSISFLNLPLAINKQTNNSTSNVKSDKQVVWQRICTKVQWLQHQCCLHHPAASMLVTSNASYNIVDSLRASLQLSYLIWQLTNIVGWFKWLTALLFAILCKSKHTLTAVYAAMLQCIMQAAELQ